MIAFAKPFVAKEEVSAAKEVILSGWLTQGEKVKQFEGAFASYVSAKYACAVSSCTTALHLALIAVGVKPTDVVVTVSHSFIATANSVRHCGAEPVFVDIDLDAFNMSANCLERFLVQDCDFVEGKLYYNKISKVLPKESVLRHCLSTGKYRGNRKIGRVAAIILVHQLGMPCDLKSILSIARRFKLPVIEDAACAIGSEIRIKPNNQWEKIGKPHGDIACFSFHPRKIMTTGEGGMITTNNKTYDQKFRLLRHHGMAVSDTLRHSAKKVIFEKYVVTGYNYRMTDIQAAIGIAQLRRIPAIVSERRRIASAYKDKLKGIPWIVLPKERSYARTNWQSYPVMLNKDAPLSRNRLMQYLLDAGVSTRRGVMNIHQEKPYAQGISLKNSELARDSVILLPMFNGLKIKQIEVIAKLMKNA